MDNIGHDSAGDIIVAMHGERLPGRLFYKSPSFARQATDLDAWEDVDDLKRRLDRDPTAGDVIKGSGGLRKIRMPLPGRGRRGGARVIYYHVFAPAVILLMAVYAKAERDDLDDDDIKALVRMRRAMCKQLDIPQ